MSQTAAPELVSPKLSVRAGSSRKLLERKAREKAEATPLGEGVEDSFPSASDGAEAAGGQAATVVSADAWETAQTAPYGPPAPPTPVPAAVAPTWSAEDESAFQTLAARRKTAGYQRRGRDVSEQTITIGAVAPNAGTVVAVIVGLVADRGGSVSRADLVAAMAGVTYPTAKARPDDKGWCQGYVAGAVRNGFLALASAADAPVAAAA